MYSAITRQVEHELIPCIRYHGLRFYAYSPLGGGLLTGKYKFEQEEQGSIETGRFQAATGGWDKIYRDRYWKVEHFNAIQRMTELLKEHHPETTMAEAAYRWVMHHSCLSGDKVRQPKLIRLNNDIILGRSIDYWRFSTRTAGG